MTSWTREKIEQAYENGRRDFSIENFSGLDLRGITLSEVDLAWADLSGADLRRADLFGANMTEADLTRANLSGVDLRGIHLTGANLTEANIDFSCWPLWCGSLNVKVDKKIAVQLMYHACSLNCDDPEYQEVRAKVLDFANRMHRPDVKRLK